MYNHHHGNGNDRLVHLAKDGPREVGVQGPDIETLVCQAAAATKAEREMGLWTAIKLYRKAVFWSALISTAIIMEGFDGVILGNLYAYPPFQEKFGEIQPDGTYQLTAAWQSGLSNGVLIGEILGLFLNGIITERIGYRYMTLTALALTAPFISIIFFAETLAQYAIGIIGTIFSWFMMRWFGRRALYLWGQVMLCLLLFTIGCTALAGRDNTVAQWAIGSLLLLYTFVYDSTIGPVCYSLVTELSSTRLRAKAVVLARNVYNVVGIATNIMTPRMLNPSAWDWGAKAAFFWAGSCFLCAIWTFLRLPEPKGRTYGELNELFEKKVPARKFKTTAVDIFSFDLSRGEEEGGKVVAG